MSRVPYFHEGKRVVLLVVSREIVANPLTGAAMSAQNLMASSEEGLDPKDWETIRRLGHRMVNDLVAFHAGLSARPAWQPVAEAARTAIMQAPTAEGIGDEAAYADFRTFIAEYPFGNLHPRAGGG